MAAQPIAQGNVYWVRNCLALEDDNVKDRPVIVVDHAIGAPVIVVACSTKDRGEPGQVELQPSRTNGLKKKVLGNR
jgi:mRNA-degrading endonuclease toxin of MazEF toxin-antitoxin module